MALSAGRLSNLSGAGAELYCHEIQSHYLGIDSSVDENGEYNYDEYARGNAQIKMVATYSRFRSSDMV